MNCPVLTRDWRAKPHVSRSVGANWNLSYIEILKASAYPLLGRQHTAFKSQGTALRRIRLPKCPNRQFRSIGNPQFSEDAIQIFFNGPFGQVQFMSDFFVEFCLLN